MDLMVQTVLMDPMMTVDGKVAQVNGSDASPHGRRQRIPNALTTSNKGETSMRTLFAILCVLVMAVPSLACREGEPNDTPDVPDAPAVSAPAPYDNDNDPTVHGCDTSWERATLAECCGLPYELFLQDKELTGVDHAVGGIVRIGGFWEDGLCGD
jgi:hypothetical protein